MQCSSILWSSSSSSNSISPSLPFTFLQPKNQINSSPNFLISSKLPPTHLHIRPPYRRIVSCAATQELVETTSSAPGFIETGYIFGVHGFQGEVRVKSTTDFPELRFSKPGTRWLKQQVSGTETIREIDLMEGRGHPGQSWIVRFNDISSLEQAQKLVGSVILVRDEDRPELEEDEFYTHDLVGMRVILKESREAVGTVVNVFNSGASDLLHVKLCSSRTTSNQIGKTKIGEGDSGPLVWVPFVEAIVPIVDMEKREMLITPPKGLLELNIRSDDRSKKERRELEWKESKKFQRRLIAAKKKLSEMEQQHIFDGFRHGEKDQKGLLANQIVTVNSKLLQQALQSIETPSTRLNLLHVLSAVPRSNTLRVSDDNPSSVEPYCKLKKEGYLLTSNGKAAIVLVLEGIEKISDANLPDSERNEKACLLVKSLLDDDKILVKIEDRTTVPLVLVSPSGSVSSLQELFLNHDYFAFDPKKVWFLEEEKLPLVSSVAGGHKILMKSPWEILQRPIGSGGLLSLFSSQESLLDQLSETGVEYIEICRADRKCESGHALLGLVDSRKANVGIHFFKDIDLEGEFEVILFSMSFFRKLMKQTNKFLRFEAVVGCNSYVEKVDKDWIDVIPTAPNLYEFRSSIYSFLDATPTTKVCLLNID